MATPENPANGWLPPDSENDRAATLDKSVNQLNKLSVAIQTFTNQYHELQKHMDFIGQAIDARTKELLALGYTASPNAQEAPSLNDVVQLDSVKADSNPKPEGEEKEKDEEDELLSLCKTMNSRGLRKYVLSHLSETTALREQVPAALKSAPKPSKLVFECIGRFFLQGKKAYSKDSPMIPARQVSVLVLEYYLLSGCVGKEEEVEASLKKEADSAAVAWRKRLIAEGGVLMAAEVDARGLILFVAGFGIPAFFKDEDICNLVSASNAREISHALRQSQLLLKRVSDIADEMIKKGMVVKAVDLAYTFGFEEKYSPQTALTSFLQKSEETWKKAKQDARNFSSALKEAHKKYLAALKSVVNCLERHKIDFVKLLPGWQLKDKIISLEKDISDTNKKIEEKSMLKRKVDKSNSSSKMKVPEAKRTRFPGNDASVLSPSLATLQEQRIVSRIDHNSSYNGSLPARLLDNRSYGYPNNYLTAASVQVGSVSDSLAEKYLGGAMGGSYSGYQGDLIRDNVGTVLNSNSHPYRWHGIREGALSHDRSAGQSFASTLNNLYGNTSTEEALSHDRPVGQSFLGQSSSTLNSLYGKTSTEGFSGPDHPSIGASSRSGGSDLYSFADAVFDS
ncbi:hypothetical protein VNO78_02246 [Psophocarpus tetragonolobus]|uniref:FRIGIDA-like protein n=1 Tax=Psophocarpus tetragonolobus TaxID=3891 RepID=A0AAN9T2C4_PSOTE